MSAATYTVIIATYNRPIVAAQLVQYLCSELQWQLPIIVVDQSDDGGRALRQRLEQLSCEHVTLLFDSGRGQSRSINYGAREAQSDWLIILDDDVLPTRDYLTDLTRVLQENPWVDALQGGVFYQEEYDQYQVDPQAWAAQFSAEAPRVRRKPAVSRDGVMWFTGSVRANYAAMALGVGGCNFVVRRDVFMRLGGFDENISSLIDREIGLRLWWYGYRTLYSPTACVFHFHHPTGGLRQRERLTIRRRLGPLTRQINLAYVYVKWFPGLPLTMMMGHQIVTGSLKRPWLLPLNAFRMWKALRTARALLEQGPRYVTGTDPLSRLE